MNMDLKMTLGSFLGLAEVKDSIIEQLVRVMIDGKFDEPGAEVEEGEKQIGEMNLLERALYTLNESTEKKHRAMHEPGTLHDRVMCSVLGKTSEALIDLMWASIEKRFAGEYNKNKVGGMGIRREFKIVTFPQRSPTGIGVMKIFAGRF